MGGREGKEAELERRWCLTMYAESLIQTQQGSEVRMTHQTHPVLGQDGLTFLPFLSPSVFGWELPWKRCDLGTGSSLPLRLTLKELTVACDRQVLP